MAAKKVKKPLRMTKKDLELKIRKLESKIDKMSSQGTSASKPAKATTTPPKQSPPPASPRGSLPKGTAKPAPPPQPASPRGSLPKGTAKPAPPPQPASPRGSLPKGMEKQTPPPQQTKQVPSTIAQALEESYRNAPITDTFGEMRAKITGYTPSPSRYYTRNTAPVGTVPTSDWNLQKATVTGYTQPSNQYFATRQRLAYHPPEKRFTGYGMRVNGAGSNASNASPPPPPPPQPSSTRGSLPKGTTPPPQPSSTRGSLPKGTTPPPQQTAPQSTSDSARKDDLATYEEDYLKRLDVEQARQEEIMRVAEERLKDQAQPASGSKRGALPKGF